MYAFFTVKYEKVKIEIENTKLNEIFTTDTKNFKSAANEDI